MKIDVLEHVGFLYQSVKRRSRERITVQKTDTRIRLLLMSKCQTLMIIVERTFKYVNIKYITIE